MAAYERVLKERPIRSLNRDLEMRDSRGCKFLALFDEMDVDKSGTINWAELQKGIQNLGLPCDKKSIDGRFKQFDANGDGAISRDEFSALSNQLAHDIQYLPRTMKTVVCCCEKCGSIRFGLENQRRGSTVLRSKWN